MDMSASYFTIVFAMLLTERLVVFSKGLIWVPVAHLLLFVVVLILDRKDVRPPVDYRKYSRIRIYDCIKDEACLMK